MQIKEVSTRTGLTIKTIRFYEERGLISPKIEWRNGKNYRDYQERDIEQLQMVAVLRKCLFSIDQIKTMLDHPELTQDVFLEYREALLNQRELLNLLADKAETVDVKSLKDPETLARRLTTTARPLPLPQTDVTPNFGRFDPETPEERQAAYLQWQKHYKYRSLRWMVPLGLTVLLLLIVTLVRIGFVTRDNLVYYKRIIQTMDETQMLYQRVSEQTVGEVYKDILSHMTYGVYDPNGNLLPLPESSVPIMYAEHTVPEIVDRTFFALYFPYEINTGERLRGKMEAYVAQYGMDLEMIHSNMFRQTMAASVEITVQEKPYTLVLYLRAYPIVIAMKKTMLFYLLAAFVWGIALAVQGSRGYGFQVRFIRSYDFFGNRWNNAILSVDENNDNATMLTQQYSGMSNLVSMDYKKDE